jgi:hypothetical protein
MDDKLQNSVFNFKLQERLLIKLTFQLNYNKYNMTSHQCIISWTNSTDNGTKLHIIQSFLEELT